MKQYLLPETGRFYKANLHCHTTVSDGKYTPEQVKELYTSHGYSVVAYTDHDVMISHDELNDDGFLALHGYEIESSQWDVQPPKARKTCHLCLIALDPDDMTQVCWHRSKYMIGHGAEYRDRVRFDESLPDFERAYTPERVNEIIRAAKEHGYFVTYNHPVWSLENYQDYIRYEGMDAMEICNYSCYVSGYTEYNGKIYDDMLRAGKRIFCIGADDNHNARPAESKRFDSCGAFTVIKAENLDYRAITGALSRGDFYASQGPEIRELWFEDGKLSVRTSAAERIVMTTGTRKLRSVTREAGQTLRSASFEVDRDDGYVRITVEDKRGLHADSRAYFTDELAF